MINIAWTKYIGVSAIPLAILVFGHFAGLSSAQTIAHAASVLFLEEWILVRVGDAVFPWEERPILRFVIYVMFVGMGGVSSTEITVFEGQHVEKGEQLGMFHFGGSTHCLVFRPDVNLKFDLGGETPGLESQNIPVRAKIATVVK